MEQGYKHYLYGYLVNEYGEVYSTKRNHKIKQFKNSSGYYRFQTYEKGVKKWHFTHITVVNLFGDRKGNRLLHGATLKQMNWSIDHLDGDKTNNQRINLEIVTHRENVKRYYRKKEK